MDDRVIYYPAEDLCCGHNLSKIETMDIPPFESVAVNDAIEFFEICKYFDNKVYFKKWSDQNCKSFNKKAKTLLGLTKRFFNLLSDDNITCIYHDIDFSYRSSFWELFDNCKLYNKISNEAFNTLISEEKVSPHDLFRYPKIVSRYSQVLRNYILEHEFCVKILLHVYQQDDAKLEKLYLPPDLSGDDINNYLEKYIDGEHPNTNYLLEITNMRSTNSILVTDEVRLKAKRRYEKDCENILKSGSVIAHDIHISFNPNQEEPKLCRQYGKTLEISYSTKWLLETLDYPSILNNFIYIFEFVDVPQMRCAHVNRPSQSGIFERIVASQSSKIYPHNHAFGFNQGIASLQMDIYYRFLEKENIYLEDVLTWFFSDYLQSEFGCAPIRLSMPTRSCSYAEKCSSIITVLESILKQYSMYVKKGTIDFELVAMSTTPTSFEDIPSLVLEKYVYGSSDEYKSLAFWLFSDQSMLTYIERILNEGHQYNCFLDLLLNEQIYLSDYRLEETNIFQTMAKYDLISIDETGKIAVKNKIKLAILRDLFQNEVISRWHYDSIAQDTIEELIKEKIITTKSTLFSKPETNYINYLLNRAEYDNGLEIRNRYMHGIQQVNLNEEEHKQNYLILLRLFILLAIKINDDFCLNQEKEEIPSE